MSLDRRLRLASLVSELHCLCCYLNLFFFFRLRLVPDSLSVIVGQFHSFWWVIWCIQTPAFSVRVSKQRVVFGQAQLPA